MRQWPAIKTLSDEMSKCKCLSHTLGIKFVISFGRCAVSCRRCGSVPCQVSGVLYPRESPGTVDETYERPQRPQQPFVTRSQISSLSLRLRNRRQINGALVSPRFLTVAILSRRVEDLVDIRVVRLTRCALGEEGFKVKLLSVSGSTGPYFVHT